ncbi:MAG: GGDEF domain-containing protein [Rhodoferax sp.]|nr:GGDEF domain-containing protein [Rhodoferax sp.]
MLNQETLLLVQVSFTLLITLLLTSVALTGDALSEQRLWAVGNVVSCLGLAVGASEQALPLWMHGAISYGLLACGLALVLRGLRKFCGSDLSTGAIVGITVVAIVLPGYFALVEPSLRARLLVTGLYFSVLNMVCAWTPWHQLQDETRKVMWASLLGFVGLAVAMAVRALYMAWPDATAQQTDLVVSLTLLAIPVAQVSVGFGLMVMVAHRYALKLNRLSTLDSLTGAYNRTALERLALKILNRARQSGRSVCIALVDADHFKKINDSHGHPVGDLVLQHLVGKLSALVRPGDMVVRYGGEEFLLVLDGLNLTGASQVAERLRETVATSPVTLDAGTTLNYQISIGISCTDTCGFELKKLVESADGALYQAKQQGRNRVCVA